MTTNQLLGLGIAILLVLLFNFIPTMIAFARAHPERKLISQINVLALLSFLLWFSLIVWAIGGQRDDSVINRFIGQSGNRGRLFAIVAVLVGIGVATTAYALTGP